MTEPVHARSRLNVLRETEERQGRLSYVSSSMSEEAACIGARWRCLRRFQTRVRPLARNDARPLAPHPLVVFRINRRLPREDPADASATCRVPKTQTTCISGGRMLRAPGIDKRLRRVSPLDSIITSGPADWLDSREIQPSASLDRVRDRDQSPATPRRRRFPGRGRRGGGLASFDG